MVQTRIESPEVSHTIKPLRMSLFGITKTEAAAALNSFVNFHSGRIRSYRIISYIEEE